MKATPPGVHLVLTPQEERGQKIYARNGCAYCHTEQVRFTPADEWRFGAPTQAWETGDQYPQMWGTRRIGPDLARESGKRPIDWQLVHLYDPRYTVPDSVMPNYPWLFHGGPDEPSQDALDLVAYLNTLGRAAIRSGRVQKAVTTTVNMRFISPLPPIGSDLAEGKAVFQANCSGCHGGDGRGDSTGGQALRPVAFDLAGFRLQPDQVLKALEYGVPGTAMPSWTRLPESQIQDVAAYVLSISTTPNLRPDQQWAPSQTLMLAGQRVFDTHCARCHGDRGEGDGPDAASYLPRPANFHLMEVSYSGAAEVIHNGVPGSGMPAWPLLTPEEIQAVTYYIRSLYQGKPPSSPPSSTEEIR